MKKDKVVGLQAGWNQITQSIVYACPWFQIRKDEVEVSQTKITYSYLNHSGSVFIVPITKLKEIILIRSYRYTVDDWSWGVPSGGIQDKMGKSIEECARDEMLEEAGCIEGTLEDLGWYYTAFGVMNLKAHYFLARDVTLIQRTPEVGETIDRVEKVSLHELKMKIDKKQIRDGESVLALLLAIEKLKTS